MQNISFSANQSFTVPVTAGNYAPEEVLLGSTVAGVPSIILDDVTVDIEAFVATAVLELWLLKVGGDPTNAAHYFFSGKSANALGHTTWSLGAWRGAKIRVKSGGTAGTLTASVVAD